MHGTRRQLVTWFAGAALVLGGLGVGAKLSIAQAQEAPEADHAEPTEEREAPAKEGEQPAAELTEQETQLIRDVHRFNQEQIAMAELAAEEANDEQVRNFASMLRERHQREGQRLDRLAQRVGLNLEEEVPEQSAEEATPEEAPEEEAAPEESAPEEDPYQVPADEDEAPADDPPAQEESPAEEPAALPEDDEDPEENEELRRLRELAGQPEFDQEYLTSVIEGHQQKIETLEQARDEVENESVHRYVTNAIPRFEQHTRQAQQVRAQIEEVPVG